LPDIEYDTHHVGGLAAGKILQGSQNGNFTRVTGNFERTNALKCMTYENRTTPPRSREERAALMEKRREDAEKALNERRKADDAFRANFERLRAERLAREAAASNS
jgi:hypothetical protein